MSRGRQEGEGGVRSTDERDRRCGGSEEMREGARMEEEEVEREGTRGEPG